MSKRIRVALALVIALFITPASFAQSVERHRMIELAPQLWIIQIGERKSNLGLSVGEQEAILIDAHLANFAENLGEIVSGTTDKPVKYVVNTHFHGDHNGANSLFRAAGASLIAHSATREIMSMPSWSMIREAEMPASPASALANVVIDDASTLYLDGREHRIEHQPAAHTAGDLAIFLPEENVLFTGDVVSIERLVLADSRAGGSLKGLIEAHQRFIELSDAETVVVPGHGELTDREALVKSVEFLLTIRERLMAAQEAGVEFADLDPDAIFASTGLGAQLEDPVRVNLFLREAYSALQPQRARLHL